MEKIVTKLKTNNQPFFVLLVEPEFYIFYDDNNCHDNNCTWNCDPRFPMPALLFQLVLYCEEGFNKISTVLKPSPCFVWRKWSYVSSVVPHVVEKSHVLIMESSFRSLSLCLFARKS